MNLLVEFGLSLRGALRENCPAKHYLRPILLVDQRLCKPAQPKTRIMHPPQKLSVPDRYAFAIWRLTLDCRSASFLPLPVAWRCSRPRCAGLCVCRWTCQRREPVASVPRRAAHLDGFFEYYVPGPVQSQPQSLQLERLARRRHQHEQLRQQTRSPLPTVTVFTGFRSRLDAAYPFTGTFTGGPRKRGERFAEWEWLLPRNHFKVMDRKCSASASSQSVNSLR